ncbi:hypothetical protein ACF0H5_007674 [Mactra antiquata]
MEKRFNMSVEILTLPDECLVTIFRCLHYSDIVSLSSVCKRLNYLCYDDKLWKWQCIHKFLDNCKTEKTWREHFIGLFKEYGHYKYYKEIKIAWNKVENFLSKFCPSILESLQDGVSETDLNKVEDIIGHKLPEDLRMSYRIHNGQTMSSNKPGLMGGGMVSTHIRSDSLVPLNIIQQSYTESGVVSGCCVISLDFATEEKNYVVIHDTDDLKTGNICYIKHGSGGIFYFTLATSFREWFCDYADKLDNEAYYITHGYIFRFYHEPRCIDGEYGIIVKPTTCFIPELSISFPSTYFFAYRIILEMDHNSPLELSCRLKSRYWHITDGDGNVEEVRGPGVVGEYPVMKPGAKFDWISCVTFDTPVGEMKGSFTFVNLRTGEEMEVPCPAFKVSAPLRVCHVKS